jgi:hypothetical protein
MRLMQIKRIAVRTARACMGAYCPLAADFSCRTQFLPGREAPAVRCAGYGPLALRGIRVWSLQNLHGPYFRYAHQSEMRERISTI